jgi:hypothetical protein
LTNPTITLSGPLAAGTYTLGSPVTPPITPPITPPVTPPVAPPVAGASWVFQNGVFVWGQEGGGDYSFALNQSVKPNPNYAAPGGLTGGLCVAVAVNQWGGWLPFYVTKNFDTSPFKFLTYSIKPTIAGQIIATAWNAINDVPDGPSGGLVVAAPGMTKYGPVPQPGVWGTYKIPLADFGLTNPVVQKFSVASGNAVPTNLFYVDAVGFLTS